MQALLITQCINFEYTGYIQLGQHEKALDDLNNAVRLIPMDKVFNFLHNFLGWEEK